MSIIFYFINNYLLGIFTIDITIPILGKYLQFINILLEIGRAANLVLTNALKVAGNTNCPFIFGIIGMWLICIPCCL